MRGSPCRRLVLCRKKDLQREAVEAMALSLGGGGKGGARGEKIYVFEMGKVRSYLLKQEKGDRYILKA